MRPLVLPLAIACERKMCPKCKGKKLKYAGLIVHDFGRSAARELRRAGVPESTIMDIGGWKTRELFKRYAITDTKDIVADRQARAEPNRGAQP